MVHVPFFNIDLPEPRLGALIPDTVGAFVQCTYKALEYGQELLHPLQPGDLQAFERSFEATIPREFNRVRQRYADGKIANDEQLSSELEDASFDWYRRQLRTSVIGATDEEMDDVAARKMGLAKPSLQAALQERHLADAVAAAGGVDVEAEMLDAAALQAVRDDEQERRRQLAARTRRLADLRRQVRPANRQMLGTLTNASGGLLLGVLLFKSAIMATQRLFGRRKPQQRPQQQQRRVVPPPAAAPQQRPPTAAPPQQAAARQQGAADKQRQPQGQGQASAAAAAAATPAAAAAGSARKARAVKKR